MTSINSLRIFIVAFALFAAVLSVSSSPLVEVNRPAATKTTRFSRVFGQREPGDYLARNETFLELHPIEQWPKTFYKRIDLLRGQVITMIAALDQTGNKAEVSVDYGGPGEGYVILAFQYRVNAFYYIIEVYAKTKPESE